MTDAGMTQRVPVEIVVSQGPPFSDHAISYPVTKASAAAVQLATMRGMMVPSGWVMFSEVTDSAVGLPTLNGLGRLSVGVAVIAVSVLSA